MIHFSAYPKTGPAPPRNAARLPDTPGVCRETSKIHEGMFFETLPAFLDKHDQPMRFMHVDCDLYASCHTVFDLLKPRIGPGTVIVFDEYFNYPNWQEHEYKAFQEYIGEEGRSYEYLAFCARGGSVAVRITA